MDRAHMSHRDYVNELSIKSLSVPTATAFFRRTTIGRLRFCQPCDPLNKPVFKLRVILIVDQPIVPFYLV